MLTRTAILDQALNGLVLRTSGTTGRSRSMPFTVLEVNDRGIRIRNSRNNERWIQGAEVDRVIKFKSGEIDRYELKENRNNSYIFGILTFKQLI